MARVHFLPFHRLRRFLLVASRPDGQPPPATLRTIKSTARMREAELPPTRRLLGNGGLDLLAQTPSPEGDSPEFRSTIQTSTRTDSG